MDKKLLRKKMIERRDTLTDSMRVKAEYSIFNALKNMNVLLKDKTITSFVSFKGEVSMTEINRFILQNEARLLLPRIVKGQPHMTFHHVENLEELVRNDYGILEPNPMIHPMVPYSEVDFVLTPGVAFDLRGFRLGYGGGYYDRFFSDIEKAIPKIGIAFEIQVLDQLPTDPYDMQITHLITEANVRSF